MEDPENSIGAARILKLSPFVEGGGEGGLTRSQLSESEIYFPIRGTPGVPLYKCATGSRLFGQVTSADKKT